ncbi:MAG: DUF86 domain-containing protein [Anaerolineae bacterium]|nr:DUF86 domain-containing protein [Anaerolineae bacterium]
MPLTDDNRLKHMLDAAQEAITFAQGMDRAALGNNRLAILAIVKDIEIIGEAASKVSETRRDQHPQIPWRPIIDMRNHLIHGYFDVDVDQVWSTLIQDLPPLIAELQKIVPDNRA